MSKIQFAILAVSVLMMGFLAYAVTTAVAMILIGVGVEAVMAATISTVAGIFTSVSDTTQETVVSVSEKLVKTSVSWGSKFKTFVHEQKEAFEASQFNKAQGLVRL